MHHIYEQLHLHLDRHPMGFPTTASGCEMGILKKLFTREEAEIALHLTPRLQTVGEMAAAAEIPRDEMALILANMADKGAIFEDRRKGEPRYSLVPFMPGFWEFQVHHLDGELAHAFEEFYPDLGREMAASTTSTMRVVPAEPTIARMEVIPYQKASEMLSKVETVAITDCICRKEKKLTGHGCSRPHDSTCMYFTPFGEFLIDKGMARKGTVQDALKVLERAENAGLVHLASNEMERISAICQCCPCCCASLRTVTELKIPTGVAKSDFLSIADIELCNGCEACVAICPVKAISLKDEKAEVRTADCIGCGLCVLECPTGALSLTAKKKEDIVPPPRNWGELMKQIALEKGKTYFYPKG